MTRPIGYSNGRFVPASEIAIPLDDAGFVWGATVTDRLRTFNGKLFRLNGHLARFRQSCELARIPQPRTDAELAAASERLVAENGTGTELSLVWLATAGRLPGPSEPTLIAYTSPLDKNRVARLHRWGARLVTVEVGRAADPRIKHRSRLNWWIVAAEARARDAEAEPLFVDGATGHVLETPTANLFAVLDGVVTSPPAGTVLAGVSLGVVRELCRANAIPFAERPFRREDLGRASEVLLSNTSYCVAGVSRIDDRPIAFPGPTLNRLLDAWTDLVGVDVRPTTEC